MRTMRDILAEQPFLAGMAASHLDLVAGCSRNVHFEAGRLILHEGDPADEFYLLAHGRAAIELFVPGRGPLVVQTLVPGDVVGWSWLIEPYRWRYDARAVDDVRAVAVDGRCLREKAAGDHDLGYEVMRRVATLIVDLLQAARLQLLDMYSHAGGR